MSSVMTFQSVGLSKSSQGISVPILMQLLEESLSKLEVAVNYIQETKMQYWAG